MGLKQDQNLSNEANQGLTLSQEREIEVNQNRADLGNIENKLENSLKENNILSHYSQEARDVLMGALSKEIYIKYGENPDIRSVNDGISPTSKEYYISARVGEFQHASIKPENVLEEYAQKNPSFDMESAKITVDNKINNIERQYAFSELSRDVGALKTAVEKAENYRNEQITQREQEIKDSKFWGFKTKNTPEPIKSLEEKPLTKEEILMFSDPNVKYRNSYNKLVDDYVYRVNEKIDHNHYVVDVVGEKTFFLNHMIIAPGIGAYSKGSTNITTDSIRYATQGHKFIDRENDIKVNEPRTLSEEIKGLQGKQFEGTEINAFRHALWQSIITSEYGASIAKEVGDSHENNPRANMDLNIYTKNFNTLLEADEVIDLLNNEIGRKIGSEENQGRRDLALKLMDEFHKEGLYVAVVLDDGGYRIEKSKISDVKHEYLSKLFNQLDDDGICTFKKELNNRGYCEEDLIKQESK